MDISTKEHKTLCTKVFFFISYFLFLFTFSGKTEEDIHSIP